MTEEKIYLSDINKIIKSGNPKFLSYVSKEYMRHKDSNPQVALAIFCMIQKEAHDTGSVYGIFLNSDGSVNLDSMSDISKITNLSEFVNTVSELSEQNIDFSDLTADELIKEGESIAAELAKEAEMLESEIDNMTIDENTDLSSEETAVDSMASDMLTKVSMFAAVSTGVATIIASIKSAFTRMKNTITRKKSDVEEVKVIKQNEKIEEEKQKTRKDERKKEDDSFCPKVKIDIGKAVEDTERENKEREEARKNGINLNDSVDDNPADDFLDF